MEHVLTTVDICRDRDQATAIPLANTRETQLLEIRRIVIQPCQSSGTGRRERKKEGRAGQSTGPDIAGQIYLSVTRGVYISTLSRVINTRGGGGGGDGRGNFVLPLSSSSHNYHPCPDGSQTAVTSRTRLESLEQTILKACSMIASSPRRPNYQPVDPSREFLRAHGFQVPRHGVVDPCIFQSLQLPSRLKLPLCLRR